MREVREETGMVCRLICYIDRIAISQGSTTQSIEFYLMEACFETAADEQREIHWFSFSEALEKLSFPESRDVLEKGERLRRARDVARVGARMVSA